jgi:hypothetical protein
MYLVHVPLSLLMQLVLETYNLLLEQLFHLGMVLGNETLKFLFPLLIYFISVSLCLQGIGRSERRDYSLGHFLLRLFSLLAVD